MACGICASSMAGKFANGIAAIENLFTNRNGSPNQAQPLQPQQQVPVVSQVYGGDGNVYGNPTSQIVRNGTNPL